MDEKLPHHGPISCRKCWTTADNVHTTSDGQFRVVNDPGAWGSATPEVLVLGISKGFTQANAFANGEFESVPFKGCRPRLREALALIGLMDPEADISETMMASEQRFGWGSLVRCSLSGWNNKKSCFSAGTPEVLPAFEHPEAKRFLHGCTEKFLGSLPSSVRYVALLGNSEQYIKTVGERLQALYPSLYVRLNSVAHKTGQVLWVHTAHPSLGNGHFPAFVSGDATTPQGRKRELAKAAVLKHHAPATPEGPCTDAGIATRRPEKTRSDLTPGQLCLSLKFTHSSGDLLYPSAKQDRASGAVSWVVAKPGSGNNTKDHEIAVIDEATLVRYVVEKRYAVRCRNASGTRNGLYSPDGRSVRLDYQRK